MGASLRAPARGVCGQGLGLTAGRGHPSDPFDDRQA